MRSLCARRLIRAPRGRIHAFLRDVDCHRRLTDGSIRLLDARTLPSGHARGLVTIDPPLLPERTVHTELNETDSASVVAGRAYVAPRTTARVAWHLDERQDGTLVSLEAVIEDAGRVDRLLLALGGGYWLERRFRTVLARLEAEVAAPAAGHRDSG